MLLTNVILANWKSKENQIKIQINLKCVLMNKLFVFSIIKLKWITKIIFFNNKIRLEKFAYKYV